MIIIPELLAAYRDHNGTYCSELTRSELGFFTRPKSGPDLTDLDNKLIKAGFDNQYTSLQSVHCMCHTRAREISIDDIRVKICIMH